MDNALITAHMMGSANEIVTMCMKNKIKISKAFLDEAFLLCWDSIKR